jgi:hypothetical protein
MEIEPDAELRRSLTGALPLSRYTLTPPDAGKWRRHAAALARVWPGVAKLLPALNAHVDGKTRPLSMAGPF